MEQVKRKPGRPRKNAAPMVSNIVKPRKPAPKPAPYVAEVDGKHVAAVLIHLLDGHKPELKTLDDVLTYAGTLQRLREQMRKVLAGEARIV